MLRRILVVTGIVVALFASSSCSTLSYYAHVSRGQLALLSAREDIATILADPSRDAALQARLQLAVKARRYAVDALHLPDNASYTRYADLHRSFVVWNVFAATELSLKGVEHCFPVAGCVAYRGYYDEALAKAEAQRLTRQGLETYIGGVAAYSTLGYFDDPILSTMLRWDDDHLAASIFHELAHQQVYAAGDTAFNESFATFVEGEGLRQWRAAQGLSTTQPLYAEREEGFNALLFQVRQKLDVIYTSALSDGDKRAAKAAIFAAVPADYAALKRSWNGWPGYDRYFATPLNNAKLLPFDLYHQHVAAFTHLFEQVHHDWPGFYQAVADLAALQPAERQQRLAQLAMPTDAP